MQRTFGCRGLDKDCQNTCVRFPWQTNAHSEGSLFDFGSSDSLLWYTNSIKLRRCSVKWITNYHHTSFLILILWTPLQLNASVIPKHYRWFYNGTLLVVDCQTFQPKSSWLKCIEMHRQSSYNYWAKIRHALIHMVITQLKWCFLDLVIFCDKAYNSINPVLTLCFNFLWG